MSEKFDELVKFLFEMAFVTLVIYLAIALLNNIILGIIIFGRGSSENEVGDNPDGQESSQTIGNDTIGYVTVPQDWKEFVTINTSAFMYTDPTETYVIALDSTEKPDKTIGEIAEQSAKNMTNDGFKEVAVNKDKLAEIEAYRIDAFSISENKWVMNWVFIADDNLVHIVSFETPNYDTEYASIPQTFRLKNEQ